MDLVLTVRVDDLHIAYVRAGEGDPLVFLHGGISDHREWRGPMDALRDRFTVVAWDTPGAGGSDDPPATYRMRDYADRLGEFIDVLGLGASHVCGLSWGSTLALELYRLRPDLVRSLILVGAYAGWAGSLEPAEVERRLRTSLRDLEAARVPEDFVRPWLPTLFSAGVDPAIVEGYLAMSASFHPAGVRTALTAMAEADLRPVLPTIAVPTLLVVGERDVRSPEAVVRAMADDIPGAELVVLPGVGHVCHVEAPAAFEAAVRAFLDRVAATTPR
jgi:pimeloyl-ACP methyl ester carboxylesterase